MAREVHSRRESADAEQTQPTDARSCDVRRSRRSTGDAPTMFTFDEVVMMRPLSSSYGHSPLTSLRRLYCP